MTRIPLVDLQAQYRSIKPEIDAAIQRVLDRGQFILGPEVEALEQEIAAYCGTQYAVAVASGTDALELSLRACGIGSGQEVITTAFSFFATAEAIFAVGAVPVFVDIELETYNLDPAQIAAAITPRTKAILPVHLYGHPCAIKDILSIATTHRLKVIEDCAQAIGATYKGKRVGSFGDAGAISFYPTKNLGGYGDGGMVVTNDGSLAAQVQLLRAHGSRERYQHLILGTNSRLDELQAAVLRIKLRHLDAWNAARRRNAALYTRVFQESHQKGILVPEERPECTSVYHLYTIRCPNRERMKRVLAEQGVDSQIAYPCALPAQPALKSMARTGQHTPKAEQAAVSVLSLPMYPELRLEDIEQVITELSKAVSASSSSRETS